MLVMIIEGCRNLVFAFLISVVIAYLRPMLEAASFRADLISQAPPKALPVPVDHIRKSEVRNSWHAPRGKDRRHEGIDIFAPKGAPVRSTTDGLVIRLGNDRLGGNVVWVLGPGGERHYYAHLDQTAHVTTGQRIQAGTLLGFVGNTGNAKYTPAHLHYGIYGRSGPINPFPLLRATSSRINSIVR